MDALQPMLNDTGYFYIKVSDVNIGHILRKEVICYICGQPLDNSWAQHHETGQLAHISCATYPVTRRN